MAEVVKYQSSLPVFSEILEIISSWSGRKKLSDQEKEDARAELQLCLLALKDKTDGMSGVVRERVDSLLASMG